ncbi:hypothetical protein EB230_20845 [Mesorhizobium sp. NZP2234]|nr:hypothetical protein EB230_20845 [Mesorhizobium sp. NZP2234]
MIDQRASARSPNCALIQETTALELLENYVASAATADLVGELRSRGFTDSYVVSALLAGAITLIRGLSDPTAWAALLEQTANDLRDADGR